MCVPMVEGKQKPDQEFITHLSEKSRTGFAVRAGLPKNVSDAHGSA
jgi:hypothetical protein